MTNSSFTTDRIIFLDKIRYSLVLGVVILHAACAYAPIITWWSVREPESSGLFNLLIVILDIFLMPGLFFLAGYFALPSLAKRRGSGRFVLAKFKRLGIPLLLVGLFWVPVISYIRYVGYGGGEHSYLSFWWMQMQTVPDYHWVNFVSPEVAIQHFDDFSLWHLWFISVLLIFFILTALANLFFRDWFQSAPSESGPTLLSFLVSLAVAALISILGFSLVNRFTPDWGWGKIGGFILIQPTRIPIYITFYLLGICSYKRSWFKQAFPGKVRYWLVASLISTVGFLTVVGNMQQPPTIIPWSQALAHGVFRVFSCLSLLGLFLSSAQRFSNQPSLLWRHLHPISYDIYLIHLPFVVIIQWLLYPVPLPVFWKFAITCLSSLALCWFLGVCRRIAIFSQIKAFLENQAQPYS